MNVMSDPLLRWSFDSNIRTSTIDVRANIRPFQKSNIASSNLPKLNYRSSRNGVSLRLPLAAFLESIIYQKEDESALTHAPTAARHVAHVRAHVRKHAPTAAHKFVQTPLSQHAQTRTHTHSLQAHPHPPVWHETICAPEASWILTRNGMEMARNNKSSLVER